TAAANGRQTRNSAQATGLVGSRRSSRNNRATTPTIGRRKDSLTIFSARLLPSSNRMGGEGRSSHDEREPRRILSARYSASQEDVSMVTTPSTTKYVTSCWRSSGNTTPCSLTVSQTSNEITGPTTMLIM